MNDLLGTETNRLSKPIKKVKKYRYTYPRKEKDRYSKKLFS